MVIAVDTNVVVRLLTADDREQTRRARAIFAKNTVLITKTVLLETEWVLRYAYDLSREAVLSSFELLLGLSQVEIESQAQVAQAMVWYRDGLDFADALHLSSAASALKLVTFDEKFQKKSAKLATHPPVSKL